MPRASNFSFTWGGARTKVGAEGERGQEEEFQRVTVASKAEFQILLWLCGNAQGCLASGSWWILHQMALGLEEGSHRQLTCFRLGVSNPYQVICVYLGLPVTSHAVTTCPCGPRAQPLCSPMTPLYHDRQEQLCYSSVLPLSRDPILQYLHAPLSPKPFSSTQNHAWLPLGDTAPCSPTKSFQETTSAQANF